MQYRVLPLFAVLPFVTLDGPLCGPSPAPPCRLALELHVRTPRHWGAMDVRVFAGEVDRLWAPYGVTFCWPARGERCDGVQVTLRIFIAERARASSPDPGRPVIGWIGFRDGLPGTEIELSSAAALQLAGHAQIGFRPISSWPGTLAERLLPRVLARGLAHEIGHYVLHSRTHTPAGLMRASFTPEQVTRPSSAGLTLSPELAAQVRNRCLPDSSRGAITALRLESPGRLRVR